MNNFGLNEEPDFEHVPTTIKPRLVELEYINLEPIQEAA